MCFTTICKSKKKKKKDFPIAYIILKQKRLQSCQSRTCHRTNQNILSQMSD